MKSASRLRVAPVLLLGLVAVAVFGRTPSGDAPVRWTMRNADSWMTEWDGVRDVRLAAAAAAIHMAADQMPMTLGGPVVLEPKQPTPPIVVAAKPVVIDVKPIVVADADLPPRDVPKQVPADAPEPQTTGATAPAAAPPTAAVPQAHPTVNRTGKTDRLFSPAPFGRATEQEIFTRPTLAVVPPSQEGWPPVTTIASLTAPQSTATLPRVAIDPARRNDAGVVVAMMRTGPGRVVTQSAIAALGGADRPHGRKGPIVLPPVPEAQVATLPPRSTVWAQPDVPAIGYANTSDVEYRFKSLLGDEEDPSAAAKNPDDQLPP